MNKSLIFSVVLFTSICTAQDVDSLMNSLAENNKSDAVVATFKSTKLVLLQTNETQKKNNLAFWVGHRFGDIGGDFGGSHTLFGLDIATDLYLGFDYGVTDDLTLGIGRSKADETYNLLAKYKLIEQLEEGMPVSVTLFGQGAWITREDFQNNEFPDQSDRISYFAQVIVARKFSPSFSLMLNPGFLARPKVSDPNDNEGLFSLGMGGRLKLTKRLSVIADYTWVNGLGRPSDLDTEYYNPLGIGLEIETGGHVFSLNFQNAPFIIENNFIPNTQKSWEDGGVRFGFAISRNFYVGKKRPVINDSVY